jgi:DnaJ-domain-containing protein 1
MILNQERRQALQDLEQMTMFALSDGVLDGRERKVIGAVARGLKLTREEMDQIRLRAISRGKELTARMK